MFRNTYMFFLRNVLKSQLYICYILGSFLIIQSDNIFAQLTTVPAVSAVQLVNNLVGAGVTVSNITYLGVDSARGTFNGIKSNIGINGGIILSTGLTTNATGPNDDPINGSPYWINCVKSRDFSMPGDADLEAIEGCIACTNDASVLEFDFIPESTPLTFKYVFASEEYPFYVCSGFNDVFAFFLTGQNPSGPAYNKKNIAFIPGTTIPVAINSVNSGTPGYNPTCPCYWDSNNCTSLAYSTFFTDNGDGSTPWINTKVQYNGFTTPFTATADVIPCKTYHLKLAIADVIDGKYDSAVLLEQNSFKSSGASVSKTSVNPTIDTLAVGCNDVQVCFTLAKVQATAMVIPFNFKGSTADTTGKDFVLPLKTVTIPAGQLKSCINIHSIANKKPSTTRMVLINAKTSECAYNTVVTYIKDYTNPSVAINPANIAICQGGSTSFAAIVSDGITNKPYTYLWNNGSTASTLNVAPAVTTTYTVTVNDACGNQANSNIVVRVNSNPILTISKDTIICNGGTATLKISGAGNSGTYKWSNGSIMPSITVTPFAVTTYTVTATDANACSSNASVVVTVSQNLSVSAGNDATICQGSNVTLIATSPQIVSFKWSNGAVTATNIVSPANTTIYTITVSDANSCFATDQVMVTVNPNPVPAGQDKNICTGTGITLTVTGAGNGGNYFWNTGDITSSISVNPVITTTYYVTLTDKNGCVADTSLQVIVHPDPVAVLPPDYSICKGNSTTINASGAGSNGTYSWNTGSGNPSITVTPQLTSTYAVTVTDKYTCTATASVVISVNNNPVANAGLDTAICAGGTAALQATGGNNYLWSTGDNTNSINVSPANTTTYFVTVSDNNGCAAKGSVIVTVNPMPSSDFTISPSPICVKQFTTIKFTGTASAGATFQWNINGDMSKTGSGPFLVSWDTLGNKTIILTVIDNNCTSTTTTNHILVNALPMVDFTATNINGCQPLTVRFTDNSQFTNASSTYLWGFGDGETSTEKDPNHIYTSSGTYTVTLTVFNAVAGCDDKKVITDMINVLPKPKASYYIQPGNIISELNPTIYVFSNSTGKIILYNWKLSDIDTVFQDSSFIHIFKTAGTYNISLMIENIYGCIDTTSGKITVKKDFTIYVPNAFIPGKCKGTENCVFRVQGTNISEFQIRIYDRWDALVYQSGNINEGWDGRVKNAPPQAGVYIYRIDYKDINHRPHTLYGSVTLVR